MQNSTKRRELLTDLWKFAETQKDSNYTIYWPLAFYDVTAGNSNRGRPENFFVDVPRYFSDKEKGPLTFAFSDSLGFKYNVTYMEDGIVFQAAGKMLISTWQEAAEEMAAYRRT